jgi:CPA2 family monovalent cation:H+ antiporter-2
MPHDTTLITTIVGGLVLAFILGALAHRLKLPPLAGYLVAGILVGPHTPGFVADQSLANQLAEIGVILLMFGVGLHFSLKDLLSVRFIAVPGAAVQITVATLMGWGLGEVLGWPLGGSLVFGMALSVASTVVLLKALQDRRLIETERGRIAVGWLIVEDIASVLALVLIPAAAGLSTGVADPIVDGLSRLAGHQLGFGWVFTITLVKVAAFVGLMLVFGQKLIPALLHRIAHSGSRELFRLGVLAIALGVAFVAATLFGASLALGAFFAGMVLAESELSHRAAQESLPLRDAFSVLFFVSVGMLFDPRIIIDQPISLLVTVGIIVFGKSLGAFLIVLAFRRTVGTALTIAASLAQIGEFSFILVELGVGLKMLPTQGRDLILAGAIISIILNPFVFILCGKLRVLIEGEPAPAPGQGVREPVTGMPAAAQAPAAKPHVAVAPAVGPETAAAPVLPDAAAAPPPPPKREALDDEDEEVFRPRPLPPGYVILVGYGRVGSIVGEELQAAGQPFRVIEDSEKRVAALKARGIDAVLGNAADGDVLALADPAAAGALMVAIPDAFEAGQVVEQARQARGDLLIVGRAHSDEEVVHLTRLGADRVIMGEREIAQGMVACLDLKHLAAARAGAAAGPGTAGAA